jgi:oligoribonuclease (3'-5' exoribonuclease)
MGSEASAVVDPSFVLKCAQMKNNLVPFGRDCAFIIFDCETTGLSCTSDYAYEIAALFVVQTNMKLKVEHVFHSYLNWLDCPNVVEAQTYIDRFRKTNEAMKEKHPDVKRPDPVELRSLGRHPAESLTALSNLTVQFFEQYNATHMMFACGHNLFSFDANMMHHNCSKLGVRPFIYQKLVDTGLIVKAAQLNPTKIPKFIDHLDWILELNKIRAKGVYWNLGEFCTKQFQLTEKLPAYIREAPHTALTDSWKVFELYKLFSGAVE